MDPSDVHPDSKDYEFFVKEYKADVTATRLIEAWKNQAPVYPPPAFIADTQIADYLVIEHVDPTDVGSFRAESPLNLPASEGDVSEVAFSLDSERAAPPFLCGRLAAPSQSPIRLSISFSGSATTLVPFQVSSLPAHSRPDRRVTSSIGHGAQGNTHAHSYSIPGQDPTSGFAPPPCPSLPTQSTQLICGLSAQLRRRSLRPARRSPSAQGDTADPDLTDVDYVVPGLV
ncbi:uncharacterized protein FIBRA_02858 [Fibroporia radiculosa]|uniref:Uncharacterized protein n=1 Tax=Fibroporia radiculosa TaxID=599839 RepID=J4I9A4_9APHY|nr:uncharacterized protein FIBRA_02858 [Fibroporia radiculosa]CCM00816.1 predicted protein [Fibroporia radiculosa]